MAETFSRRPQRRHPIELKREVAEQFAQGCSKRYLSRQYDVARASVTLWAQKRERGEFDDIEADMIADLRSTLNEWEKLAGRQALTIDALRSQLAAHSIPDPTK